MTKQLHSNKMTFPRRVVLSLLSAVLFLIIIGIMVSFQPKNNTEIQKETAKQSVTQSPQAESFSYTGRSGVDALTLLKENAVVELDRSGMVSSINGRKADTTKREFWSFYINGKLAEVGSADYQTNNSDKIEWRIETY